MDLYRRVGHEPSLATLLAAYKVYQPQWITITVSRFKRDSWQVAAERVWQQAMTQVRVNAPMPNAPVQRLAGPVHEAQAHQILQGSMNVSTCQAQNRETNSILNRNDNESTRESPPSCWPIRSRGRCRHRRRRSLASSSGTCTCSRTSSSRRGTATSTQTTSLTSSPRSSRVLTTVF